MILMKKEQARHNQTHAHTVHQCIYLGWAIQGVPGVRRFGTQ
jgi:hypothetical protein